MAHIFHDDERRALARRLKLPTLPPDCACTRSALLGSDPVCDACQPASGIVSGGSVHRGRQMTDHCPVPTLADKVCRGRPGPDGLCPPHRDWHTRAVWRIVRGLGSDVDFELVGLVLAHSATVLLGSVAR